jgi:hypothetical protein
MVCFFSMGKENRRAWSGRRWQSPYFKQRSLCHRTRFFYYSSLLIFPLVGINSNHCSNLSKIPMKTHKSYEFLNRLDIIVLFSYNSVTLNKLDSCKQKVINVIHHQMSHPHQTGPLFSSTTPATARSTTSLIQYVKCLGA